MNAKFLLRKYLNTGIPIPEYQFNKLNTNLRTTYIRKRSIAIESGYKLQSFEIPYISQDTWIKSVEKNAWNIEHIKNPTPQVQMAAVEKRPYIIKYIENPTPQVQMVAVEKDGGNIKYIKNPTDEVQDYILKNYKEFIFRIKNPNNKIKPLLDLEEYQMYAIENSPYVIQYIKNPTDEVQDYIFDNDSEFIRFIKNPNEKIKQYKLDNNINESRIKIIINESQLKTIIKDII
jgi:hypothetical protein